MMRRNGVLFGAAATLVGALTLASDAQAGGAHTHSGVAEVRYNVSDDYVLIVPVGGVDSRVASLCAHSDAYQLKDASSQAQKERVVTAAMAALVSNFPVYVHFSTSSCSSHGYPWIDEIRVLTP